MSIELAVVKKMLPKSQRTLVTQEFLDKIEASVNDPLIAENFKDNFISYLNVLRGGRYKLTDYISAVKYISYKLLGYSNVDAYASTFPDRYAKLKRDKPEQIDSFVSMYNQNKLVISIYEQTVVPTWVLNVPLHQKALSTLAEMIQDPSVRGMTKVKACEAILAYTKQPEVVKGEITIGLEKQDTIDELRDVTEKLASTYQAAISSGVRKLRDVTEAKIITVDAEVSDADN